MENVKYPIAVDVLKALLERAKLLKLTYATFMDGPDGLDCDGLWGEIPTAIKRGSFQNNIVGSLPVPFTIVTTDLVAIIKDCDEAGIERVFISVRISKDSYFPFPEYITNGIKTVYLPDHYKLHGIVIGNVDEFYNSICVFQTDLTNDQRFMETMQLKAADGGRFVNIGRFPMMISPSLLNLTKGDLVKASIFQNGTIMYCQFTVTKPKKKCEIYTTIRFLPL